MSPKEQRRVDDFILYAVAAADEAVADSGWAPASEEDRYRTGVNIGSGIGGLSTIADTAVELHEKGPRRGVGPFFITVRPDQSRVRPGLDQVMVSKDRTIRWSPPAPPARTPWVTRCASFSTATPT